MLASLSCGLLLSQLNKFCVFSRVCHIGIDKALPTPPTACGPRHQLLDPCTWGMRVIYQAVLEDTLVVLVLSW